MSRSGSNITAVLYIDFVEDIDFYLDFYLSLGITDRMSVKASPSHGWRFDAGPGNLSICRSLSKIISGTNEINRAAVISDPHNQQLTYRI